VVASSQILPQKMCKDTNFFLYYQIFFVSLQKIFKAIMRKFIITICLASLLTTTLRAEITRMGGNMLSFGVGFGWLHKEQTGAGAANFPSPQVRYERGVHLFENVGVLTVGGIFGIHSSFHNGTFQGTHAMMQYRQSWTSFYLLPITKLYFHEFFYHQWGLHRNIELYAGLGFGVRYVRHNIWDGPIPPEVLPRAAPWEPA
jgi:hypothetical protein